MENEINFIQKTIKTFDIGNATPIECLIFLNDKKERLRNYE